MGVAIAILSISAILHPLLAQPNPHPVSTLELPDAAVHPLPSSLETWVDTNRSGEYFEHIKPAGFGYLVWSDFPLQVVLRAEPLDIDSDASHQIPALSDRQKRDWHEAVMTAVQEWDHFIPIEISEQTDAETIQTADIIISAQAPPLRWPTPDSNVLQNSRPYPRARTAETTYTIYLDQTNNHTVMKQQYQILLAPNQSFEYLKATARHELGHALGIWGHSPTPDDVLYFSQVQTPPSISARDINTLKKIYQQPTQLGWPLKNPGEFLGEHGLRILPQNSPNDNH